PGDSWPQRPHPRAQYRGPVPRAQPNLLLRERRRAGSLPRQRRLDASQSPRGRSKRPPRGPAAFSSQDFLIGLAEGIKTPEEIPVSVPRRSSRALIGRALIGKE